ncbi:MAG: hypothetical protein HY735_18470 [Verrucomicrobia bacterium]|nr:hypothetical protein [Verrucomicrobiota bacterium]
MEGPTPVSALIHAATMVAAGVFLVARVYPLMETVPANATVAAQTAETLTPALSLSEREREKQISASDESIRVEPSAVRKIADAPQNVLSLPAGEGRGEGEGQEHAAAHAVSTALKLVTWIGAITAAFAALIAVAQTDIKRILAYSTVSQLGYMMMGLGVGGVAVGMFHLITHAFFKALLFLGAGSVIHGCHDEQDIRRMGGLKPFLPVTFGTYAVGMMALAGVPVFFAGFWSKDDILHNAAHWPVSSGPFWLGVFGALLTAFYMTRQVCYVFFGQRRAGILPARHAHDERSSKVHSSVPSSSHPPGGQAGGLSYDPHESPPVMTTPLVVLAVFAVVLGFFGTPAWPWFQDYISGHPATGDLSKLFEWETSSIMLLSTIVVALGLSAGWWLYGRLPSATPEDLDPLERMRPSVFQVLRGKFYVDELYEATVIRFNAWTAWLSDGLDRVLWDGVVRGVSYLVLGFSWISRFIDEYLVNLGFDKGCDGIRGGGKLAAAWQTGQVQPYLRVIGLALAALVLLLSWGRVQ